MSGVGCSEATSTLTPNTQHPTPTALFGEGPSRIVVSVRPEERAPVEAALTAAGVPWERLGTVGGPALVIGEVINIALFVLEEKWEQTLPNMMSPGRR